MRKRIFALLFCVVLCAAMVFSYSFIVLESEHDCIGDHCHICVALQICHTLIRNLAYADAVIAMTAYGACCLIKGCTCVFNCLKAKTPVLLKVKLLN